MAILTGLDEMRRSVRVRRAARVLADERRPLAFKVVRAVGFAGLYLVAVLLYVNALGGLPLDNWLFGQGWAAEVVQAGNGAAFFKFGLTEGLVIGCLFTLLFPPLLRGPFYDALNRLYDFFAKVVTRG